jgi:hypothetical protein
MGTPRDCNRAIKAPAGADITGRSVLAVPLIPAGSQLSAALALICRTSPACKSTPVSVQGCAVEMVNE